MISLQIRHFSLGVQPLSDIHENPKKPLFSSTFANKKKKRKKKRHRATGLAFRPKTKPQHNTQQADLGGRGGISRSYKELQIPGISGLYHYSVKSFWNLQQDK